MRSSSSSSNSFFLLQRSLNPVAPRPFGLVALRTINKGSIYQIVTNNNNKQPVTLQEANDDENETSATTNKFLQDLSKPPKMLYDLLFRRFMWNVKESGYMDFSFSTDPDRSDEDANTAESTTSQLKILLPPPFLMISTATTVYALSDPNLIAKQVFEVAAKNETSDEEGNDDADINIISRDNETSMITGTKHATTAVGHNIITLNQLLSINDACSIPVPAPMSEQDKDEVINKDDNNNNNNNGVENSKKSKNPSNLDPAFWRTFPDLMQQYEEISTQQANCVLEFMTEEELADSGHLMKSISAVSGEKNDKYSLQQDDETDEGENERQRLRREKLEAEKEDRQLAILAKEFKVGPQFEDADAHEYIRDEDDDRVLDGDLLLKKRLEKKREFDMSQKRRKGGGRNPFLRREAKRKQLKGETKSEAEIKQQQDQEEEELEANRENLNAKSSSTLHLVLRVTKRINPGSEFYLSFGREFWTQFAGACAFTSTTSLPRVRWVEKYLSHDVRDLPVSFPDVAIGRAKPGVYHLVDRVTESKASDDIVVAEFVRRISLMPSASVPPHQQDNNVVDENKDIPHHKSRPQLLRSTLDRTAHRLLEKSLQELLLKKQQQQENEVTNEQTKNEEDNNSENENLVQRAAELVAAEGTDGLLNQEITMKDLRHLLAEDILKSKRR